MPAVGARALLSATRTRVITAPSVAISSSSLSSQQRLDARTFRTSSTSRAKPSEEPAAPKLAGESPRKSPVENTTHEKTGDNAQSTPEPAAQSAVPAKEVARSQGFGSSRARAWRGKTLEEMPPVNIPPYWSEEHIWPYDRIRTAMGSPNIKLPRMSPERLKAVVDSLWPSVDDAFSRLKPLEAFEKLSTEIIHNHGQSMLENLQHAREVANWYLLSVTHHSGVGDGVFFWLQSQQNGSMEGGRSGTQGSQWLKRFRPDHVAGPTELLGNAAAKLKQSEYSALAELVCRARNELAAVPPKTKPLTELHRPVTVLSVLNYKGAAVANEVICCLAYELEADVLHLDARSIADIIGNYLGQTPYWSRGALSTLGYAAAEMNGRIPSVAESADEAEGTVTFDIPSLRRLGPLTSKKDLLLMGSSDERWEDLKTTQALESLIRTLDTERLASGDAPGPERPVIIHVRDYIELGTLAEAVLQRLRAVVDRLWRKGKRIILIGSSSSDVKTAMQWRAQLAEMSKEDCHVIPYHTEVPTKVKESMEKADNTLENVRNITNMLLALEGNSAVTGCTFAAGALLPKSQQVFENSVLDLQAIYRLASVLLGSSPKVIGATELEDAMSFLDWRDMRWVFRYPGVASFASRGSSITGRTSAGSGTNMSSDDSGDGVGRGAPPTHEQELDKYEKGLISGLINAKDIRTTFNDIVVPEPMVESIKALTSLHIVRPQAFSYGILKVERIPGLLMYGPPGTGKTLLAKAIAKESGANMLEISAATINNMYVGQGEKNVAALFRVARKLAPMIIFLDEGDALLGKRNDGHGHASRRVVLTQFLREMDGLTEANKQVFVIVATNRPFDLDDAILRRLPRKVLVDLPLQPEREAILRILLKEETLDESVSLATLAAETDLYSGSDLKNFCVAAAMDAVKEEMRAYAAADSPKEGYVWPEKRILTRKHFDAAVKEIGASISEDMESLKAIRKFDDQYGDASGRKRRRKKAMGFEVIAQKSGSEETRVRTLLA
ncbi:AAA-domain-containing protein [Coniochaeta ligniaria NRRL 30616]|uniref:AAA-domain-containing protein n=1 Tax=Coniochaeta ligniaria NRRL 30616 TaxID=1408157 RepID=A0A1J7IIP7_9PEZI|nr:AAA-domain-containing protein [Coniochaeta ligniaria NRRL 30616]